jgi:hypothetical protein
MYNASSATLTSYISLSSEYDSLEDQKKIIGNSASTLSTEMTSQADTSGNNNRCQS